MKIQINDVVRDMTTDEQTAYEAEIVINVQAEVAVKLAELRTERNSLLAETDYWTLSDTADITDAQTAYRTALRDITNSATSLDDVTWPEKP